MPYGLQMGNESEFIHEEEDSKQTYYLLDGNSERKLFSSKDKCVEYLCNKYPTEDITHNLEYDVYVIGKFPFFDPTYYITEIVLEE